MENCRQKDFFFGALVGGTVATLTSLLFTTRKGRQIQRQLADTYNEVEGSVKEAFSEVKSKAEEVADHPEKKTPPRAKHDDHHK